MPNRNVQGDYRYGYQGEYAETDKETGLNAFQLRMYDSRIGRWISPDPYGQFNSPYLAMDNRPNMLVDPDGGCTVGVDCPKEFNWMETGTIVLDEFVGTPSGMGSGGVNWETDAISAGGMFNFNTQSEPFWIDFYANMKSIEGIDFVNFPSSGNGFTRYGDVESGGDHYVQKATAASILNGISEFRQEYSSATVQLGNMSNQYGGKPGGNGIHTGGSLSHMWGRNVDVRYIRLDRKNLPVNVNNSQFDRAANQSLVNAFRNNGFNSVLSFRAPDNFLLNGTVHRSKHHNHLHFQGHIGSVIQQ